VKDFCLHSSTLKPFTGLIADLLESGKRYRVEIVEWRDKRSIPQNSTWRGWMDETAKVMAARGVTMDIKQPSGAVIGSRPINAQDCHELFVGLHGGYNEDGLRMMTSKSRKDCMTFIMDKHMHWCAERGIRITIPRRGEFAERMARQEA